MYPQQAQMDIELVGLLQESLTDHTGFGFELTNESEYIRTQHPSDILMANLKICYIVMLAPCLKTVLSAEPLVGTTLYPPIQ
jgi:hypothetical protein